MVVTTGVSSRRGSQVVRVDCIYKGLIGQSLGICNVRMGGQLRYRVNLAIGGN